MTAAPTIAPPVIRPATEADVAAIQEIYAHHVLRGLSSFEEWAPDATEMARRRAEILGHGLPYLVAEEAGRVRGFAYAGPYRLRSAYRYTVEDSVYLAPDAYRRGLGQGLLGEIIEHCTAQGYRQMVAVIGNSANAASIGLHRKLGFAMAGRLPSAGYKFGNWIDSVLMQRPLGPGAETPPSHEGPAWARAKKP